MTVEPESCIAVRRDRRYLVREPRSERMLIEREPNAASGGELARISQKVTERFYNLSPVALQSDVRVGSISTGPVKATGPRESAMPRKRPRFPGFRKPRQTRPPL